MSADPGIQNIEQRLPILLTTLEVLQLIGRYLNPPELAGLLATVGAPDEKLRDHAGAAWPENLAALGAQLDLATDEALAAFEGLRASAEDPGALGDMFRAMRHIPKALEALYPLACMLPPVNRFFLDADKRKDVEFQKRFLKPPEGNTGIIRFGDDHDARETVWAYVPETYSPDVAHPLVVALHGGSGRGRAFLWSWVRDARSRGAIVAAPTSVGQTWAIQGTDADSPRLAQLVKLIGEHWNVDSSRVMLTGMSDGGTFSYVSGLDASSPFTHLAPAAAAFHPMLAMADENRIRGLPIHITHGRKDWMFPVDMARQAEAYFRGAGARVTYREVGDLSHTYPVDLNGAMLDWLNSAE
ncbi:MAG TPA: dienelactone hydrolase family protein [Hyphomonadaceae bacterium]|nr:dienelactone hydrolase family protein [Hyphomonadaceae bacterium]